MTLASGVYPTDAVTVETPSPVVAVVEIVTVMVEVAPTEVTVETGAVRFVLVQVSCTPGREAGWG